MYHSRKIDNLVIVKKLGHILKIISFNYPVKQSGFEDREKKLISRGVNDYKLESSISRSKSIIYEYALCNDFDYFVTFTLNSKKYDRENLSVFIKDLGQYIRNYRRKYNKDIQYLFIPEKHKDGAWHMHGLIKGLDSSSLVELTIDMKLPYTILNELKKGNKIYDWIDYSQRFGYCTLSPVRDIESCAKYVMKYISKDLAKNIDINNKCYYVSRGLKKAEVIKKGTLDKFLSSEYWSYSNDWVKIKNLNISDIDDGYLDSIISDL